MPPMATFVFFHAHPDDESIGTGGTMARAVAEGHRTVLVLATKGEHGEVAEGFLDEGETLTERRVRETHRSAEVLGVSAVHFLGYVDSGMMGTPENDAPDAFWQADLDEAATRLAELLRREQADVLTVYDDNGTYGHPDHIQVHRVGVRAAALAGVDRVFEVAANRDEMIRRFTAMAEQGLLPEGMPEPDEFDVGVSETRLTHAVDVTAYLDRKRASMRAHASQIAETDFFLAMPDEHFGRTFGVEWYIRHGAPTPVASLAPWLLDD
jgi:LmbE family N-acetylglucosaminyl deacetylase